MNRRKPWRFPACSVTSTSLSSACKGHPDGPLPPSLRTSPPRHSLFRHGHYTAPHVNAAPSLCQSCPRTGTWPLRPLLPSLGQLLTLQSSIPGSRPRKPPLLPPGLSEAPGWPPIKGSACGTFTTRGIAVLRLLLCFIPWGGNFFEKIRLNFLCIL